MNDPLKSAWAALNACSPFISSQEDPAVLTLEGGQKLDAAAKSARIVGRAFVANEGHILWNGNVIPEADVREGGRLLFELGAALDPRDRSAPTEAEVKAWKRLRSQAMKLLLHRDANRSDIRRERGAA